MGVPSSSRASALQMVQSFTSPVLADPSGCLPIRPASSSARKGIPVPSMPRYKVCGGAMIVGAFESQGAQHTDDVLGPARDITRSVPTRTTKCTRFIGKIGVETLLNGVSREPQSTLAQSDFQGLEIQLREGLPT